ncbi:hypothetical protein [Rummeliibacillus stabekisii]|uniref:hypothetical protein n=1 Tax=Rummeliibacillus stabekisii TaxID=241244 RepID=UPI0037241A0C
MLGFLPTNMTITVTPKGELDRWGELTSGTPFSIPAFVTSNSDKQSISISSGDEVVYKSKILIFEKVIINEGDTISWTDALGITHSGTPLGIDVGTDLDGKFTYIRVVI